MPRLVRQVPRYSKHRASGQAVVTLSGRDFYLGPYGTKASKLEYDRLIVEWLAAGRRRLTDAAEREEFSVAELLVAYKRHAEQYYRKNGKPTSEVAAVLAVTGNATSSIRLIIQTVNSIPSDLRTSEATGRVTSPFVL